MFWKSPPKNEGACSKGPVGKFITPTGAADILRSSQAVSGDAIVFLADESAECRWNFLRGPWHGGCVVRSGEIVIVMDPY